MNFFVESGDSVVDAGDGADSLANVTLDYGADYRFDGSLGDGSTENTTVRVAGSLVNVSNVTIDHERGRAHIELATPVNASAGDRVTVVLENGTTSTLSDGENRERMFVEVSVEDPDGNVDGPVRIEYSVIEAHADLETSVVARFETPQQLHVRGTLPNRGYVVVRRTAADGPGEIVGVSDNRPPDHFPHDVTVTLDEPLSEDTRLQLSLYRETTGNGSYDPGADEPYRNAGTAPRRTVTVAVPDADAYVRSGTVWAGQSLLYEGRPNTPYALHRVTDDGDVGETVGKFTATRAGVVTIDTADLSVGERYVLVNRIGTGVVDLDGDGEKRVSDDAMTVATQTLSASAADGTLVVDSERGDYTARVTVDSVDDDTVRSMFGESVVRAAGDADGVPVHVPADGRLTLDTTALEPNEYDLSVTAPDTGAGATTTLTVEERATTTPTPTTDAPDPTATTESTTGTGSDADPADRETPVTAPLGPLVPLIALVCAGLLFARGRD